MENEKVARMMFEAAEDRATLNAVKNILVSDVIDRYATYEAICAAVGIRKADLPVEKR